MSAETSLVESRITRPDRPERVPWGAVLAYIAVSFGLAWIVALPLWLTGGASSPHLAVLIPILGAVMMFTPAIAVLVATLAIKAPRRERLRFLGMWPLRPAKRVVWFAIGAVFAPILIVVAIALISAALGLMTFDLREFSGFQQMLDGQLAALPPEAAAAAQASMPPLGVMVAIQLVAIPFGALVNTMFAFGEEIGWRGWLLPVLRPLGVWPALLITGVVWGLWHAPLILLGYNFGLTDWRGVALMVAGCVVWGALLGWARLRSASVWPAAIGHGALNAAAGLVVLLAAAGSPPDMAIVGPFGAVAWAVIAVIVVVLVVTGQFRREPELAPRRVRDAPTELLSPTRTDAR